MGKRLSAVFALLSIIFAQVAMAANQKPPDVPTPVVQTVTYASGITLNKNGATGSATVPDTPPYYSTMPADIPTTSRTNWLATADGSGSDTDCVLFPTGCEAKFRSHLNVSHILYDDPIRNYGEPGTSHCHQFFGNMRTNAFSTFNTLRTYNEAKAAGGRLNGTGYWAPCIMLSNPFSDGKNYAVKMTQTLLYYFADPSVSPYLVRLPRGLRYVGGVNMDDPDNSQVKKELAAANAQSGTAGRYATLGGGRGDGFNGWNCATNAGGGAQNTALGLKPTLVTSGGTDPWGGACAANGNGNAFIWADFDGPDCWDGINPWVPGGYAHMRYSVTDQVLDPSGVKRACPDGWYHIPAIRLELTFTTTGYSDYSRWRLSSDDGMATKLASLPSCTSNYSNAPCRSSSSSTVANGGSFHTDWFGAWDDLTFRTWMSHCLGVRGLVDGSGVALPSTPHLCAGSLITTNTFMKTGTPPDSTHSPIISLTATYPTTSASNMFRIRTTNPSGMQTHHVH